MYKRSEIIGKCKGRAAALALALAMVALGGAGEAATWKHIDEADWIGGARLKSQASLAGKIVLVDVWGVNCPPCRALLPRLAQTWESFRDRPFVLIGSHRQGRDDEAIKELISKNNITYPVYQGAGLFANEPSSGGAIPFIYVVNDRGKVIYRGRSLPEATEAVINAFELVGKRPGLTDGVTLDKYKSMAKNLVLGKPIKTAVAQLERDAEGPNATKATEAKAILKAIARALKETKDEIEYLKGMSPKDAVWLIKQMKATWPEEAEAYKADFGELVAAAREQVAAERASATASSRNGAKNKKR